MSAPSPASLTVIHWNARGLAANQAELLSFLRSSPDLVFVSESRLSSQSPLRFPGFSLLISDPPSPRCGGLACLVSDRLAPSFSPLLVPSPSPFFSFFRLLSPSFSCTFASVYLPPSSPLSLLDSFFSSLSSCPSPWIVVGDFNAHHPLWGSPSPCPRGTLLADLLSSSNLVCLNTGEPTFFSSSHGTHSHLDVAISSPSISRYASWRVHEDALGSDHFPCVLSLSVQLPAPPCDSAPKWAFRRANWQNFSDTLDKHISNLSRVPDDLNSSNDAFTKAILTAAQDSLPTRRPGPSQRPLVPWWSSECARAVAAKRRAYQQLRRSATPQHLSIYRRLCAQARRTIRQAKRQHWIQFCSSLNSRTPLADVWSRLRLTVFNLPRNKACLPSLTLNEKFSTLANQFTCHTPDDIVHPYRKQDISTQASRITTQDCSCTSILCLPFTLSELDMAISRLEPSAAGPDQIFPVFLKHLPTSAKTLLLDLYNLSFRQGQVPDSWRHSIVLPVLKPNRSCTSPDSFRPISLTSAISRLFERMIHTRLQWFLTSTQQLSLSQTGFLPGHSVLFNQMHLEHDIRQEFNARSNALACFLDIDRAFDSVWHAGLLVKCHHAGIPNCFTKWISSFLSHRTFQIRLDGTFSATFPLPHGTPQGCPLSPLLFNIMLRDLPDCLPPGVRSSLYADDLCIWTVGRDISRVSCHLQDALDQLEDWATDWGFAFSPAKSITVPFSRQQHNTTPRLRLASTTIPTGNSHNYLGIVFDSRLTWKHHLQHLKTKCCRRLNLMRYLCGLSWGCDRRTLLRLYFALIRPVLDFGSPLFLSAPNSFNQNTETLQAQALRIATGLPRSTPHIALQVETGTPPLHIRRLELSSRFLFNVLHFSPLSKIGSLLSSYLNNINDSWRLDPPAIALGASLLRPHLPSPLLSSLPLTTPFWFLSPPDFSLPPFPRTSLTSAPALQALFADSVSHLQHYTHVYTDGSFHQDTGLTSASFWIPSSSTSSSQRLPDNTGIFQAEMFAIFLALQHFLHHPTLHVAIFSDSRSALDALRSPSTTQHLSQLACDIAISTHILITRGTHVVFSWVPAHVGIPGNEGADQLAASPTQQSDYAYFSSRTQIVLHIMSPALATWQEHWNASPLCRHLFRIKQTVTAWEHLNNGPRSLTSTMSRLRTAHCRLNYHFRTHGGDVTASCRFCHQFPETVEHILLHCSQLHQTRNDFITPLLQNCPREMPHLPFLLSGGIHPFQQAHQIFSSILSFLQTSNITV